MNRFRRSITRIIVFTEASPPFTESRACSFTYSHPDKIFRLRYQSPPFDNALYVRLNQGGLLLALPKTLFEACIWFPSVHFSCQGENFFYYDGNMGEGYMRVK
jgi:hypothetical protein